MRFYPLILCYHAISSSWPASLAVSAELLAQHVESLRSRGYQGFTLVEAERRRTAGTLPERSVVVTFDDAYASTRLAVPVLSAAGYPGTVFVVTRFADSGDLLRWPGVAQWYGGAHAHELRPLVWNELEELQAAGWEIGSHTVTHPRLPELDDDALVWELEESRRAIGTRLGSCETIAYPYGLADDRVAAAVARAGYAAAVTLTGAHRVDTPFLRPRIGLYPHDSGLRMQLKLSASFTGLRRTRLAAAAERLRDSMGGSRTSR